MQVAIEVREAVSKLIADRDAIYKADKALAVEVSGAHFARQHAPGWDGLWHPVNAINGTFPTGLLTRVKTLFPLARIVDLRKRPQPKPIDPEILRGVTLTEDQLAGIIAILEGDGQGVIALGTGGGKTEIGIAVACHVPGRAVFVVHRKDLLHQTAERIAERTGDTAALVGDGRWDESARPGGAKFVIVMPQTAILDVPKYKAEVREASTLILDEVHRTGAAATWYKVSQMVPAYFRVGLTGTPETGDPVRDRRLEAATGRVVYRVRASELAKKGILVPARVYIHSIRNSPLVGDFAECRRILIEDNPVRNAKIVDLAVSAAKNGKRCLVICDTLRHMRRIAELLASTGVRSSVLSGHSSSRTRVSAKRDLRSGTLEVVLTSPIWDDSIDLPELEVLILAGGGKSPVRLLQRIGRALRTAAGKRVAEIHDFHDTGSRYTLRHSLLRQSICKREGFEVVSQDAL